MQLNPWALTAVVLVAVPTFYLGHRSSRFASSTHDFLVARRTVRARRNAAAVSGEYLSAASFLGVAGIVLKEGANGLWYPIGFTAGYLALMLFVAAPLRRSGAYTLPDFLEARLGSVVLRRFATAFVVFIGVLYLVPQLQGAGLAVSTVLPWPTWVGALVVTVLVALNVIGGGMRAITVVQAFQYWLKLFAIAIPAFVLSAVFLSGAKPGPAGPLGSPAPPTFATETTVDIQTDVVLEVSTLTPVHVQEPGAATSHLVAWVSGATEHVAKGTKLTFPEGTTTPVVSGATAANADWLRPGAGGLTDLLQTYSLILALCFGTMGLPHVLVRFYTNPDGKAARRTTVHVLLLLGLFYLFPMLLGAMSRMYEPQLLVTGRTDAAVLMLPSAMLSGLGGQILGGVTMAGAFAAFLSTSSGLLVSLAGVVSTDLFKGRVSHFRTAAGMVAVLGLAVALVLRPTDLSISVGMSFALAASTFSPLLVLGVWWRGLTWPGALAGMIIGGGLVLTALAVTTVSGYTGGWAPWFAVQPGLITVPAAFVGTILVSLATRSGRPGDVNSVMLRLHAPDPLGFMRDRAVDRFGQADERVRSGRGRHRK
ncbi:MAG TPA: cation acetate symporter [Amycolatopsis sp.]|uniref:sodium/solute symporter n=1 Tax=Amycolatopsis sp. TaxID=37632 RepID=UPI002B49115E|nr:cation acetate symporter [Amycolatopsis sp.]HKS48088.1 cation acetate symporter [Amycolatopsis sp.]